MTNEPFTEACDSLLQRVPDIRRTIADLDRSEAIRPPHVSEAINYRMLDRNLWS